MCTIRSQYMRLDCVILTKIYVQRVLFDAENAGRHETTPETPWFAPPISSFEPEHDIRPPSPPAISNHTNTNPEIPPLLSPSNSLDNGGFSRNTSPTPGIPGHGGLQNDQEDPLPDSDSEDIPPGTYANENPPIFDPDSDNDPHPSDSDSDDPAPVPRPCSCDPAPVTLLL
jgi:hypothetical protein